MSKSFLALAETVGNLLKQQGLVLATAESCTGGGLGYWITAVPGSSAWFDRGFITYSNAAKMGLLQVSADCLNRYGAVSKETTAAMLTGTLNHSDATVAIAITGIAGPGGGSLDKPVGTVWIGWQLRSGKQLIRCHELTGDRQSVRDQAIWAALETLSSFVAND